MKNFNRGGRSFDRRGGFNRGGGSDHHEMHKAVCSECGKSCEVPFRPSGDKPVYCSDCFKAKDKSNPNRSFDRGFGKTDFHKKNMFHAICSRCGKGCEVPFRPTGDKPVLCSACFNMDHNQNRFEDGKGKEKTDGQLKTINEKLDKILRQLAVMMPNEANEKKDEKVLEMPKAEKKVTKKTASKKKLIAKKIKTKSKKK